MSLSHNTGALKALQNKTIPPGKYIAEDERFAETLQKTNMPYMIGESYARQGQTLRPANFQHDHLNPSFTTLNPENSLTLNYGTYIYNKVTGYQ